MDSAAACEEKRAADNYVDKNFLKTIANNVFFPKMLINLNIKKRSWMWRI